jgi:hypothetical protein
VLGALAYWEVLVEIEEKGGRVVLEPKRSKPQRLNLVS